MNSIYIAHVAASLERQFDTDYDTSADDAANLLNASPILVNAAQAYEANKLSEADFDTYVRRVKNRYDEYNR